MHDDRYQCVLCGISFAAFSNMIALPAIPCPKCGREMQPYKIKGLDVYGEASLYERGDTIRNDQIKKRWQKP